MTAGTKKLDAATIVEIKKRFRVWTNSVTSSSNVSAAARDLNASAFLGKQAAEAIKQVMDTVQSQLDEMLEEAMYYPTYRGS